MSNLNDMRIIGFAAENIKKLKTVEFIPDPNLNEISGSNGAGKSSLLNSVWLALGGRDASKEVTNPLRNGTDKGHVTLDLGDLIVKRTFTEKGGSLTVTSQDGAKYSSPQGILDGLRAKFIDPSAFVDLSPKEQREALLQIVDLGFDLDAHEAERKAVFEKRTEVGREGRKYGDPGTVDESLPEVEESAAELLTQIQNAQKIVSDYRALQDSLERHKAELVEALAKVQRLQDTITNEEAAVASQDAQPDVKAMTDRLSHLEAHNAAIRANNETRRKYNELQELFAEHEALTNQIAELDKKKADALANAALPVDGLSIEEDGITLDGVPFRDCSTAQKIVAALKIAAAGAPKLKVIQIQRGESLDKNNFALVKQFAEDNGFQIFIETVGDGHGSALIIEDGELV